MQPELSAAEYALWRELIWQRCGLYFSENRRRFLRERLWGRMRAGGVECYAEYYRFVAHNAQGASEWRHLLENLVVNETSFFRHPPSYASLTARILPELLRVKRERGEQMLRMWSAGCSSGQEAYSLAIAFLEMPDARSWRLKVTGTDISQTALAKARRGSYRAHELRDLPDLFRERHFIMSKDTHGTLYNVADSVRKLVDFRTANLVAGDDLHLHMQDVIFCQNVLIYFKPESRAEVVRGLCARLNFGGFLVPAPAEIIELDLPDIEPVRVQDTLIYRRQNQGRGM